jgi:primosomal protein N' (replication factor Y)
VDRGELHYPPLARVAELTGSPAAVAEELSLLRLPEMAEILGPVAVDAPRSDDRVAKKPEARRGKNVDRLGRGERAEKPQAAEDQAGQGGQGGQAGQAGQEGTAGQAGYAGQGGQARQGDQPGQQLHRALVRVPRRLGGDLSAAVREAQGVRSARKSDDWVRVRIDPVRIG